MGVSPKVYWMDQIYVCVGEEQRGIGCLDISRWLGVCRDDYKSKISSATICWIMDNSVTIFFSHFCIDKILCF